ncbi:hypothetical protein ACC734_39710, partial [Rhizobium ruizarguesonis]
FVADLSSALSSIRFNQSDDTENEIGPLISKRQRDRVESFVVLRGACNDGRCEEEAIVAGDLAAGGDFHVLVLGSTGDE